MDYMDEGRRRCKPNGNGYFKQGVWIKLKPHQRRFEDTTLTKTYRGFKHCPACGKLMGGNRQSSTLNRCASCGEVTVVTFFKQIYRTHKDIENGME